MGERRAGGLCSVTLLNRIEGLQRVGVLNQRVAADFTDGFGSGQGHRHLHLFLDQIQQVGYALLTVGSQRVQIGAAQQHAIGAQRDHAHHIETVTNTTVGEDGDIAFYRIGDGRQRTG